MGDAAGYEGHLGALLKIPTEAQNMFSRAWLTYFFILKIVVSRCGDTFNLFNGQNHKVVRKSKIES